MTTHPKLPSKDLETGRPLLSLLEANATLISPEIAAHYGNDLPFLFKVLSIQKALSIQAHPDKGLGEQLHKKDPKNYPDGNHKPEMALAITEFEGFCGFRPLAQISHFLGSVKPMRELVGEEAASAFEKAVKGKEESQKEEDVTSNKKALKELFSAWMKVPEDRLKSSTKDLIELAKKEGDNFAGGGIDEPGNKGGELAELIVRLDGQFPGDIGLFAPFFLNKVNMAPGEAMFLQADDIHAYISGGTTHPLHLLPRTISDS